MILNNNIPISDYYDEESGRTLAVGQLYKHFKGNTYKIVIPCVYDTDDLKEYVIYGSCDNKRRLWARPVSEFLSEVDPVKYPDAEQQFRFELVEGNEDE